MRTDSNGEFWNLIVGAIVGAVINVTVSYITAKVTGQEYSWKNALVDAAAGAITGLAASTGLGAVAQGAIGAAVGAGSSIAMDALNGEEINMTKAINAAALGGVTGFIGGAGVRADPAVKAADNTARKVLNTVTANAYPTIRGAKSAMTQAVNKLHKALVPAVAGTTKSFIRSSAIYAYCMYGYDYINRSN